MSVCVGVEIDIINSQHSCFFLLYYYMNNKFMQTNHITE